MLTEYEMELSGSEEPKVEEPKVETPTQEEPQKTGEAEVIPTTDPTPEPTTEQLFDLPDGRKVTADALREEYFKLLPEFTRKSQELAEFKKGTKEINNEDVPKWKNPDYVPSDYGELVEIAKAEAIKEIKQSFEAEQERTRTIVSQVDADIAEIKKIDPKLDENALFLHANKYGLQDLKVAYQNMSDIKKAMLETEQRVLKNIKTREIDPVSAGASPSPVVVSDEVDITNAFGSAVEALEYLKRNKS